jgi:putative SOS response-associated peptidase YedK
MCYSAQVVQVVRKLHRELGIRLDYAEAEKLFLRRLDDPSLAVARGFEANFDSPATEQERRIKAAIDAHRARSATEFERELFTQKTRLVNAQRSLGVRDTKKAREEVRIATRKIDTFTAKLSDLHRTETVASDNRIFPMVYAGVIVRQGGENLLTPMRYFCRPAGKPAFIDKKFPGLYNARRDNLEKFWGAQFGHHHALMVVESFYENVRLHTMEHRALRPGEEEQNVVLQFTPEPAQTLLIACLHHQSQTGARRGVVDARESQYEGATDDPIRSCDTGIAACARGLTEARIGRRASTRGSTLRWIYCRYDVNQGSPPCPELHPSP